MPNRVIIAPSILAADLSHLQDEVDSVESYADWLQIDVMDGHFVPNLSFGVPIIRNLRTKLLLDIHLMVTNPADRIQEFLKVGVGHITFHAETVDKADARLRLIEAIHEGGATAGIALDPRTSLSAIDDVIGQIDLVLIMSVHPGFSGQKFLQEVLPRVHELRKSYPDLIIQMDGGIDEKTAPLCREAGANNLVAASAIFGVPKGKRGEVIARLRGE